MLILVWFGSLAWQCWGSGSLVKIGCFTTNPMALPASKVFKQDLPPAGGFQRPPTFTGCVQAREACRSLDSTNHSPPPRSFRKHSYARGPAGYVMIGGLTAVMVYNLYRLVNDIDERKCVRAKIYLVRYLFTPLFHTATAATTTSLVLMSALSAPTSCRRARRSAGCGARKSCSTSACECVCSHDRRRDSATLLPAAASARPWPGALTGSSGSGASSSSGRTSRTLTASSLARSGRFSERRREHPRVQWRMTPWEGVKREIYLQVSQAWQRLRQK